MKLEALVLVRDKEIYRYTYIFDIGNNKNIISGLDHAIKGGV